MRTPKASLIRMAVMRRRLTTGFAFAVAIAACAPPIPPSAAGGQTGNPTAAGATPVATESGLPAFDPAEPLLLVEKSVEVGGGIFVLRPDGTGATQLATDVLPGVHKRPDWSPDGDRVVFIDHETERMWIANLNGSPTTRVAICDTPGCDYPAWSPDGTKLAFSRYEAGALEGPSALAIFVLDLGTGEARQVIRLERPLLADAPRWSPDGTELVFQVDRMDDAGNETGAAIAVVSAAGGEPRYLTEFDIFASFPDWGWVSNEIVFSEYLLLYKETQEPGDETRDLFAIRPDGSGFRQITHMPQGQRLVSVRWAPDNDLLMAKQFDDASGGGRTVDPATGRVEQFVTDALYSVPVPRPTPIAQRAAVSGR